MGIVRSFSFDLYRWRYSLGYFGVSTLFVMLLVVTAFIEPLGITDTEKQSVVATNLLSIKQFSPSMVMDLPFLALQKAIFFLFGVSEFTIKLPSLLLALATGVGVLLLLRQWFRRNTAVLSGLLALTTGPLLLIAQTGTSDILYIFWPIALLVSGSMISAKARFLFIWKLFFCSSLALSLYTPMMVYVVLAVIIVGLLHPHLRYQIKNLSRPKIITAIVLSLLLTAPLIYALTKSSSVVMTLLGVPAEAINLQANISELGRLYGTILNPSNGEILTPVYGLASLLLMGLGIFRVFTDKYTAKSYVLMALLFILIPVLLVHPRIVAITFTPFLLLTAFGVGHLIGSWYGLFPKNPYARAAGLLPLIVFITGLTFSGIDRFMYGYHYSPQASSVFSRDLSILSKEKSTDKQTAVLLVTRKEKTFYQAVARYNISWKIQDVVTEPIKSKRSILIATHAAYQPKLGTPSKILVDSHAKDADRFYLYKTAAN